MDLVENHRQLVKKIELACARAGRNPHGVLVLPVSKGHPVEAIERVAALGFQVFGENKVQEAKVKIPQCSSRLRWHMIGHLQSNKCRDAVLFFQMIESVDSLHLAEELNKWAEKLGKRMAILLEVNVAGESSKFGLNAKSLVDQIEDFNRFPRLELNGLMTVAPWTPEPEKVRPIFQKLKELREQCSDRLGAPLQHLSMGMSGDFEVAIEEGATIIRIGTALFGPRPKAIRKVESED